MELSWSVFCERTCYPSAVYAQLYRELYLGPGCSLGSPQPLLTCVSLFLLPPGVSSADRAGYEERRRCG